MLKAIYFSNWGQLRPGSVGGFGLPLVQVLHPSSVTATKKEGGSGLSQQVPCEMQNVI